MHLKTWCTFSTTTKTIIRHLYQHVINNFHTNFQPFKRPIYNNMVNIMLMWSNYHQNLPSLGMVLKLFAMAQQLLCQFHQTICHGLKIKFLETYGLESLLYMLYDFLLYMSPLVKKFKQQSLLFCNYQFDSLQVSISSKLYVYRRTFLCFIKQGVLLCIAELGLHSCPHQETKIIKHFISMLYTPASNPLKDLDTITWS